GIRLLKTEKYDLILLDIMMEPLDGWDTLDLIGNLTHGYETPVIMVSAKKMDLQEVARYGERLYGFMKKPQTREEICAGVYSFFRWSESLQQAASGINESLVPGEDVSTWLDLSRQVRVIIDLREEAALRCIPGENMTEDECMKQLESDIDTMIRQKQQALEELSRKYPVLHTIGQ
ncbi:MAG: response regulator, partial [Methanospirillum sp.]|nr:response regulator [Methanospirillum sp.]